MNNNQLSYNKLSVSRRDVLRGGLLAATAVMLPSKWVLAAPGQSFEDLVPSDKKLTPAWINSLTDRAEPEVFSKAAGELKYIGIPIGGIGCGQLYLGGDGKLWLWDIFKSNYRREPDHGQRLAAFTLGGNYANPIAQGEQYTKWNGADVSQGFLIRTTAKGKSLTRPLDKTGFGDIRFRGEYPIARVHYADASFLAKVELEAFSPFIPLNAKDSALPATVFRYTVTNTYKQAINVDLGSWMQNATCPYTTDAALGQRSNRLVKNGNRHSLLHTIETTQTNYGVTRPEIVFADFETDDWGAWTATGEAFRGGPFPVSSHADYHKVHRASGKKVANSLNSRVNSDPAGADNLTGTLTSPEFTISRKYISMLVCGGNRSNDAFIEVLVDGQSIGKLTGDNSVVLKAKALNVSAHEGKKARLRIVDNATGGWAHITADRVVFTDEAPSNTGIETKHGYGSSALSVLADDGVKVNGAASLRDPDSPAALFDQLQTLNGASVSKPLDQLLVGGLNASFKLKPGESKTVTFLLTWYFPYHLEQNVAPGHLMRTKDFATLSRHYRPWFNSAGEVADYVVENRERLIGGTHSWNQTWYDSTLPHWFLDRSMIAIDCVATQMFHWFDNGRPYGWEGVDCCPGTCTHVWHYAQALGRIFPELERAFREEVDFNPQIAFNEGNGVIGYRGDFSRSEATDGQAGTILRAYREHLISKDDAFLKRLYPNIKKSIEFLISKDPDGNGLLEGKQPHTLDAAWFGPMGWISSLYLAALKAGEAMAQEMGDSAFETQCRELAEKGYKNILTLFNGEYFIHKPDPKHPRALQSGEGCHIDQVLGQAWMSQIGLDRVVPKKETVSALESLWKYNFSPDAGTYAIKHREVEPAFRWYAMEGEAGLLMTTWPKGDAKKAIPGDSLRPEKNPEVWTGPGGYFNECMNGFEYQVAWHMVAEGEADSTFVKKGLSIMKAVHERYGAAKRNPYNEIECSDHYARSMASYGIYLAACGFEYHGPKGYLGFAPKIHPDDFRAAFTVAEGWGTFTQKREAGMQTDTLQLNYGQLTLKQMSFVLPTGAQAEGVQLSVDGTVLAANHRMAGERMTIELSDAITIRTGQLLEVQIHV